MRCSSRSCVTVPVTPFGTEWVKRETWTSVGAEAYREALRVILCVEPCEVSMLAWLHYIKSSGGMQLLTDNAQDRKFVGGSQQISDKLAAALQGRVQLNAAVQCITWHPDRGARVDLRSGQQYPCDYVVVAMAPALYGRIQFCPPLPALRSQLCQRCPMGCIIKTVMHFERAWWREKGFSGSVFCDRCTACGDQMLWGALRWQTMASSRDSRGCVVWFCFAWAGNPHACTFLSTCCVCRSEKLAIELQDVLCPLLWLAVGRCPFLSTTASLMARVLR